ncbi:hypothetical protein MMC26_002585 [Xylographa opegraphella]|nr:hypothetical protein [Xylographa opegraphella]
MSPIDYPPVEVLEPSETHTATALIIHGMGDTGQAWKNLVTEWNWPARFPHIRFIFPSAPVLDLTLVPGSRMSSWFDVLTTNDVRGGTHDEAGMARSRLYLQSLIEREIEAGIPPSRIVLGGFSQGGAISLLTGISLPFALRGVFSLCGYLPMIPRVLALSETELMPAHLRQDLAIFVGNGTNDPKIKHPWGQWSAKALVTMGYKVDFRSYLRRGHRMHPPILANIAQWIDLRIPLDEEWADVMFS